MSFFLYWLCSHSLVAVNHNFLTENKNEYCHIFRRTQITRAVLEIINYVR